MKKIFLTSFLIITILFSCTLESEFSLPNNNFIATELFGIWSVTDGSEKLVIQQNKEQTFTVTLFDKNNKKEIISKNAYITKINGYQIIILPRVKDNKTIYAFYGYRINNGELRYREINPSFANIKITSSEELLSYFKKHIDKKDFFNAWSDALVKLK